MTINLTTLEIIGIALAIIILIGIGWIVKFLQSLRTSLVNEVTMQQDQNSKPRKVAIQHPLPIEQYDAPTPMSRHIALETKVAALAEKTDERFGEIQKSMTSMLTTVSRIEGKLTSGN